MIEDRQTITSMIRRLKEAEKRLDDYYNQHKKLKRSVNQRMDRLEDDVDELFAMECCDCSEKTINSSSESSTSEETDSDYALPKKEDSQSEEKI
jgi:predicted transcriptional regulator